VAADAAAPEAGAAVRAVPFATVVLVGAAGSARAGKWTGGGLEKLYDAVRDRDGSIVPEDVDMDTVREYRGDAAEWSTDRWDGITDAYDSATTRSVDGLQWAWDELQDGKEFVVTSNPYQKTVNSGPFNYFISTPAGVAERVGKSCASFGRDYINMKREHWGDKKELWADYISPPYGSGLRPETDGADDDEVE
jgi:hypothetical protein